MFLEFGEKSLRQKRLANCAAGDVVLMAVARSGTIPEKRLEFPTRESCVKKRLGISDEPSGPQQHSVV
jgi:hypothetical protein